MITSRLRYGLLLLSTLLSFSQGARAALSIPTNLNDDEQGQIQQILGFGTAFRTVDNPYPLGGYSGLEIGLGIETVSTEDIGYFGSQAPIDRNLVYPRITFGKGVFDKVDLFISFIPYNESTGVGIYSGAVRWGFYQATFVPASFSILIHATNTNVNNLVISQVEGADAVASINVDPFSFYVGIGTLYGETQFDASITEDSTHVNKVGHSFQSLIGVNYSLAEGFAAFELDTYSQPTLNFKIGARL